MSALAGAVVILTGAESEFRSLAIRELTDAGAQVVVGTLDPADVSAASYLRDRAALLSGGIDAWIDYSAAPSHGTSHLGALASTRGDVDRSFLQIQGASEAAMPVWRLQGYGCLIAVRDGGSPTTSALNRLLDAALTALRDEQLARIPSLVTVLLELPTETRSPVQGSVQGSVQEMLARIARARTGQGRRVPGRSQGATPVA